MKHIPEGIAQVPRHKPVLVRDLGLALGELRISPDACGVVVEYVDAVNHLTSLQTSEDLLHWREAPWSWDRVQTTWTPVGSTWRVRIPSPPDAPNGYFRLHEP